MLCVVFVVFFFQAEDGIRYLVRSRGLGDVYKRQNPKYLNSHASLTFDKSRALFGLRQFYTQKKKVERVWFCLLYTSDAADERSSVDLGGRRIIKKQNKKKNNIQHQHITTQN